MYIKVSCDTCVLTLLGKVGKKYLEAILPVKSDTQFL